MSRSSAEWIDLMNTGGVPCGPIYTIDKMFDDPQVKHIKMAVPVESPTLGHQEVVGQAITLSRTPWELRSATPERGEHSASILESLGYSADQIAALRAKKTI